MRSLVRQSRYVMTTHGQEAMEDDELPVFDIERCILTGAISERQRDHNTGEWKYVIQGDTVVGDTIATVVKIGSSGRLVVVTVYFLAGGVR
jgi:hypothetical protein